MSAEEEPVAGLFRSVEEMFARQRAAAEEHERAVEAQMRAEGIAATVTVHTSDGYGGLIAHGPDLRGAITLFAMADGTVRWKRP